MPRLRALVLLLALGCAGPPPHPPTAVIDTTPDTVCRGDAFATVIELSGARSSASLSLIPAPPDPSAPPLEFEWLLDGAEHAVVAGSLTSPRLAVTTAGDRPLHVTLTVFDADGGDATSLVTVGLAECAP
jgi:hypothetical protein